MYKTVDTTHIRSINQMAVLNTIFNNEGISRAELSRMLSMSKPSMADNVAELLKIGIIQELGEGSSGKGGGRKPIRLGFKDDFKYIISMDFYYQYSFFALSDLRGNIVNEFPIHQAPQTNFEAWTNICINAVSMLLASQGIQDTDLAAITISIPGILGFEEEKYIVSTRYGKFDVPYLKKHLQTKFNAPILLHNSTNAATIGELHYGYKKEYTHFAFVSCGQGVGSGIILDGRLYQGKHLAAGEIGFTIVPDQLHNKKVSLEDRICIETTLEKLSSHFKKTISFPDMIRLWKDNDPYVLYIIEQIGTELGCAICNLLSIVDCEIVVIGGDYLVFESQLLPIINKIVEKHSVCPTKITSSKLGEKATTLGLNTLCREAYFKQLCARE